MKQSGLQANDFGGPRLGPLGELMGEPAVLFEEKLNYKLSGGGGYRAHQDGYTQIGPSSPSRKVLLALDSVVRVPAADY